ncbi:hypothetical protein LZ30DRAFT_388315 [Colletotrichum cereale]|nr:hypothetical protein LZ30DRAFT_388315 [Colletotrichum cereale]
MRERARSHSPHSRHLDHQLAENFHPSQSISIPPNMDTTPPYHTYCLQDVEAPPHCPHRPLLKHTASGLALDP